jgi:hypothetical protein
MRGSASHMFWFIFPYQIKVIQNQPEETARSVLVIILTVNNTKDIFLQFVPISQTYVFFRLFTGG